MGELYTFSSVGSGCLYLFSIASEELKGAGQVTITDPALFIIYSNMEY